MGETRREFMGRTVTGTVAGLLGMPHLLESSLLGQDDGSEGLPWYRRAYRWGQTNLNEMDPVRYDVDWWRQHWKRTKVQGIVVNAGGIVAYYPSKFPLHYRAQHLGDRDLFGEITRAAHRDGIVVLARMDSNRTHEAFYRAHSEWFARDIRGEVYRANAGFRSADSRNEEASTRYRYITCINSPYYDEYLLDVLREVMERERPVGFTDNSWSGLSRNQICYCRYCKEKFQAYAGAELPRKKDWDGHVYRQWIRWNYDRRVEIWDINNRAVKEAGGPDALWLGMIGGDFISQGQRFRDTPRLMQRSEMVMLDDQARSVEYGFQENAEMGKRLHGLLGWEKLIPESIATYQRSPTFRKAAASKAESRMWMYSGFAGNIHPWWHHVGAFQWDRRQFQTAIPVYDWYEKNQEYMGNRQPVSTVGIVWSQENADFYGRDEAEELVGSPYYGMIQALVRARIPYVPVHADHIERESGKLGILILPNLDAMKESQVAAVRRFAEQGGGIVATGETSLYDEWGDRQSDFALSDVLGARYTGKRHGSTGIAESWDGEDHSYLRFLPDVGRDVYGPLSGSEPAITGKRHPVLEGFDETDIIAFGGLLLDVKSDSQATVPVTLIPDFPAYPPETSWMRIPRTDIPALVLNESGAGRRAYLPADIDRRFSRDNLPDHGQLLANVIRWVAKGNIPLAVEGRGLVDCHLYRQHNRLVLHLVNLTSAGTWKLPVHELIPIGPLRLRVQIPAGMRAESVRLLVSGATKPLALDRGWASFEVPSVLGHEVAVIG